MAKKCDSPDWKKIKAEYLKGGISQQKLADKYGISRGVLQYRMNREKWQSQREAVSAKTNQKLIENIADVQADALARMIQMQSQAALSIYEKLLLNIEQYPDGAGTKTVRESVSVKKVKVNGEDKEFPLKSAFVNDLEATVRSISSLAKLFGIDAASKQSRERFELLKQQGGGSDDTDTFNATMISIAELINHPLPDRTMTDIEALPDEEWQTAGDSDG